MGAITPDTKNLEEPEGASRKETTTMEEEGASQMRESRGNVAAGEGALGSAEQSATNPRQTHTCGQGQHAYGKVNVAARKAKRVVPIGKAAKGAKELAPIGKTAKGAKGMRQLPVERQTLLKSNGDDLTTKHSSISPFSKTAKGANGLRHLPVTSQSSNGHALITKPRSNFPPCKTAKGEKG